MKELERILINEALDSRLGNYQKFINKFFMGISGYNSVQDLRQYELGEEISNDAFIFSIELSDNLKEVRQSIKLIKKNEFDEQLLLEYETILVALNTIIRGSKYKLKQRLEPVLKQLKPEQLQAYNNRVVPYFKFAQNAES
jgi:uncharacterized protein (UPF0305 family)